MWRAAARSHFPSSFLVFLVSIMLSGLIKRPHGHSLSLKDLWLSRNPAQKQRKRETHPQVSSRPMHTASCATLSHLSCPALTWPLRLAAPMKVNYLRKLRSLLMNKVRCSFLLRLRRLVLTWPASAGPASLLAVQERRGAPLQAQGPPPPSAMSGADFAHQASNSQDYIPSDARGRCGIWLRAVRPWQRFHGQIKSKTTETPHRVYQEWGFLALIPERLQVLGRMVEASGENYEAAGALFYQPMRVMHIKLRA